MLFRSLVGSSWEWRPPRALDELPRRDEGELVRARVRHGALCLHEGGDSFVTLPAAVAGGFRKEQISPTRDTRLRWMQSVIHCTHYVTGAGEQAYLRPEDAPEIAYVRREEIERSNEAFTELSG